MTLRSRYTCEETFRTLDRYMDRALGDEERQLVEAHLLECIQCASEFRFEHGFLSALREKVNRIDVPPDLMAKITKRLSQEQTDT